jgi:hypothetical protein
LRWEQCWHRRGRRLDAHPDLHEMLDWWADEASAWERVQQLARHHRHWRARYELVADMQGWSAKHGLEASGTCPGACARAACGASSSAGAERA